MFILKFPSSLLSVYCNFCALSIYCSLSHSLFSLQSSLSPHSYLSVCPSFHPPVSLSHSLATCILPGLYCHELLFFFFWHMWISTLDMNDNLCTLNDNLHILTGTHQPFQSCRLQSVLAGSRVGGCTCQTVPATLCGCYHQTSKMSLCGGKKK